MRENRSRLLGDVFLASAFIVYCGPYTSSFRRTMLDEWAHQLAASGIWPIESIPFSLVEWHKDPVGQRRWKQSCSS